MNPSILTVSLVAAVAGAAAAGVVTLALAPSDAATPADNAVTLTEAASPRQGTDLVAELDELASENRELRARIEALESRPMSDARTLIEPSDGQHSAAIAAAQGGASALGVPPAEIQAQVATAIEAIRTQERAEAARAREQRELQRMEERLTDLRERLGLSPTQENDLRALLLADRAAEAEYDRQREAGMSRDALRVVREQQRTEQQAQLAKILTPEQLANYRQRDNRRGGDAGTTGNNAGGGNNNRGRGNRGG